MSATQVLLLANVINVRLLSALSHMWVKELYAELVVQACRIWRDAYSRSHRMCLQRAGGYASPVKLASTRQAIISCTYSKIAANTVYFWVALDAALFEAFLCRWPEGFPGLPPVAPRGMHNP